mmetsp:Transcript_47110/g.90894  ORF Transcript_47110/g.90894 Transcript_47110/m.90894 type:complete len:114 (-) Transcript_47110:619-960(-)
MGTLHEAMPSSSCAQPAAKVSKSNTSFRRPGRSPKCEGVLHSVQKLWWPGKARVHFHPCRRCGGGGPFAQQHAAAGRRLGAAEIKTDCDEEDGSAAGAVAKVAAALVVHGSPG